MSKIETGPFHERFYLQIRETQKKLGRNPSEPQKPIPQKHLYTILEEHWTDAEEHIELRGIRVRNTVFKMDRDLRRLEVLRDGRPATVIIGSFRFKEFIDNSIDLFISLGINVLMPPKGSVKNIIGDFPFLEGDPPQASAEAIEDLYIQHLQVADFAYIQAPGGYIGEMSIIETGLAMVRGVPIYSSEPIDLTKIPDTIPWKQTIGLIKPVSVEKAALRAKENTLDTDDYPWFRPWNNMGVYRPAPNLDEMIAREKLGKMSKK